MTAADQCRVRDARGRARSRRCSPRSPPAARHAAEPSRLRALAQRARWPQPAHVTLAGESPSRNSCRRTCSSCTGRRASCGHWRDELAAAADAPCAPRRAEWPRPRPASRRGARSAASPAWSCANVAGVVVVGLLLVALNASATHHQRTVVLGRRRDLRRARRSLVGAVIGFVLQGRTLRWLRARAAPDARRGPPGAAQPARPGRRRPARCGSLGAIADGDPGRRARRRRRPGRRAQRRPGAGRPHHRRRHLPDRGRGRPAGRACWRWRSTRRPRRSSSPCARGCCSTGCSPPASRCSGIVLILSSPPGRSHIVGAGTVRGGRRAGRRRAADSARRPGRSASRCARWSTRCTGSARATSTARSRSRTSARSAWCRAASTRWSPGLRERERIQDLFGRHVGPAVAEEAIRGGVTLARRGARRGRAVRRHHRLDHADPRAPNPIEFVAMLNRFFGVVVDAVEEQRRPGEQVRGRRRAVRVRRAGRAGRPGHRRAARRPRDPRPGVRRRARSRSVSASRPGR